MKNEKWAYNVQLTNSSRDTAKNLTIKYKVFHSNQADGSYSAASSDTNAMGVTRGSAQLAAELPFNKTMEFNTKSVQIDVVDYDGAGYRYKDQLKGMMLRVETASGEVVFDWTLPISYLKGHTWESTEPAKKGGKGNGNVTIR